jgi:1,2-dihydroxy-3-keto-5-methylthiopentene dioxygenase
MAILSVPSENLVLVEPKEIKTFMNTRNLFFDRWTCEVILAENASQEEVLKAYSDDLIPFMEKGGYQTADVISISTQTINYPALRQKFLAEHTHTEDEIRFFVEGQGYFWFHLENGEIFNLCCQKGDIISVPAGTKHWFDAGETDPRAVAIRIFTDSMGWTPHYTNSEVEKQFLD